jgi:hypothetical protein
MTETKVRCDACGGQALPIQYNFKREMDGAGSMETNYDTVDLCHEHTRGALQKFLEEPPLTLSNSGKEAFSRWAKGLFWGLKK